jgi:hypothetical protein
MLSGTAPRLTITSDGELSRLRGAAAVVLQRHSGHGNSSQGTHPARTPRKTRSIV